MAGGGLQFKNPVLLKKTVEEKNKEKRKKGYFLNVITVLIINIMFAEWNQQLAMHSSEFYIVAKLRNYSAQLLFWEAQFVLLTSAHLVRVLTLSFQI